MHDRPSESSPATPARPIAVLKFGSSVLEHDGHLERAVAECYRHVRDGRRVVAVVSAFGNTTNELIAQAERVAGGPVPPGADWAFATLQGTGETVSAGLLGIALERSGLAAGVVDAAQIRLTGSSTGSPETGSHGRLEADPTGVDTSALLALFDWASVIVVPGYVLIDAVGLPLLLGRGGSDMTAVFIGSELARAGQATTIRLIKDVAGVYESDPAARVGPRPGLFTSITWSRAMEVGGRAVQGRALRLAEARGQSFEVAPLNARSGTLIGPGPESLVPAEQTPVVRSAGLRPMRIALLGLGTVGAGVYRALAAEPERFTITGIAVRDPSRHAERGFPEHLLTTDAASLLDTPRDGAAEPPDVIVELIGGRTHALACMLAALRAGRRVVTANKAAVAGDWPALLEAAAAAGLSRRDIRFSAAVGGVMPAIEAVTLAVAGPGLSSIAGVINGTCNLMLDLMLGGMPYADALAQAQRLGFAEADPTLDVDGTDAAQKLTILVRQAVSHLDQIRADRLCEADVVTTKRGIDTLDPAVIERARAAGDAVRLVARAEFAADGSLVSASVAPAVLPALAPLAVVRREWNRLILGLRDGSERIVSGKGAGRYPTAQAVLADILDLEREHREIPAVPKTTVAVGGA